jgi:hypothetical protein
MLDKDDRRKMSWYSVMKVQAEQAYILSQPLPALALPLPAVDVDTEKAQKIS